MTDTPLVAIHNTVYNHEPYLRECLDGFVMQKTDFRFVVITHDDCSTDGSAAIIREYAEKYPDIFRPIYETENQYSKRDGSLTRIMNEAIAATGAKYVAMCEGDDYWTDPYKLQKQVDFMEEHEEYSICFHKVKFLYNDTGELVNEETKIVPAETTILDLAEMNYISTPSVLFRYNDQVEKKVSYLGYILPGDYVYWMLYAELGKIYKLEEVMSVYRVGSGIWSTNKPIDNCLSLLSTLNKLYVILDDKAVRDLIQIQIRHNIRYINQILNYNEEQLHNMRKSIAYRLGKLILKPFTYLKSKK